VKYIRFKKQRSKNTGYAVVSGVGVADTWPRVITWLAIMAKLAGIAIFKTRTTGNIKVFVKGLIINQFGVGYPAGVFAFVTGVRVVSRRYFQKLIPNSILA